MTNRNELERLLAAATEGPWDHTDNGIGDILISGSNDGLFENFHFDNPKSSDDAALICFLRNNAQHYLSLMDEVERLSKLLAERCVCCIQNGPEQVFAPLARP